MQETTPQAGTSSQPTGKIAAYLNGRWTEQNKYYSDKSRYNQRWHQRLQIFIGVGSVAVPVLIGIAAVPTVIPAILSGLVAAAAVVENVYHFGDNWRNFRNTREALKYERALFDTGLAPYDDPNTAGVIFVQRSEDIMAKERGIYFEHPDSKKARPQGGASNQGGQP